MKNKIPRVLLAASLLFASFGFNSTAHAVMIEGDTNYSLPTTIATYLTFSGANFTTNVMAGPGTTNIDDLGTFTISACSTNNCSWTLPQDGTADFTLKITFTVPTVSGSPESYAADIFGTISKSGGSNNIANGSSLTIDFDNTHQNLTYTNGDGSGMFELWVDDVLFSYSNSSTQFPDSRTVIGHISNLTFTPSTPPTTVPEPGSMVLLGLGFVGLGLALRWRRKA